MVFTTTLSAYIEIFSRHISIKRRVEQRSYVVPGLGLGPTILIQLPFQRQKVAICGTDKIKEVRDRLPKAEDTKGTHAGSISLERRLNRGDLDLW
jgi:hypothetical protein